MYNIFVLGRSAEAHEIRHGGVHKAEFQPEVHQELRRKDGTRHRKPLLRALRDRPGRSSRKTASIPAIPEEKTYAAVASFQLGHGAFQGFAVRVIRSRVIVAFILAQLPR